MTLPELLIAVTMLGLIAAVLSSAIIVTLRQSSSTEGRLNVARAEQQVGMWLPGDLASAAAVSVDPAATPCDRREVDGTWAVTGGSCPDLGLGPGSNALLVGWSVMDEHGNYTYTNVSYFFSEAGDGTFQLTRIECVDAGAGWSCSTLVVLRNLPGPPGGAAWEPGVTRPDWVIQVSEPLAANAIDESNVVIGDANVKNARRVVVTVNGGGSSEGAGGGSNQISITAGGTYRNEISGTSLQGAPSFTEARSRCGGPVTLLVDESNSVGRPGSGGSETNVANVKNGVREFVTALSGTPAQVQVIGFHTYSHALGSSDWHRYYDMTNEADVAALLASIDTLRFDWPGGTFEGRDANGGTNWEEALFRTFYTPDGSTAPIIPETVVFFTDGVPTFDRLVRRTDPGVLPAEPPAPAPGWPASTGSVYSQVAFNRANFVATWARSSVNLVGVAVGDAMNTTSPWVTDPGAGFHWQRGYVQYQRALFQSDRDFERASSFQSNRDFEEQRFQSERNFQVRNSSSSSWRAATPTEYYVGWASNTSNRRIPSSAPTRAWYNVTQAEYDAYHTLNGWSSRWRTLWADVTPTTFYTNQPGNPSGYRDIATRTAYAVTEAEYDAYASLSPANWWISGWTDVTPGVYFAGQPSNPTKFRINGARTWYTVTPAEYAQHNVNSTETDGWRVNTSTMTWISKAEYDANNTVAGSGDGWHDTGFRTYVAASSALDWEVVTRTNPNPPGTNPEQYRKVYEAPIYGYDPPVSTPVANAQIIGRLIAGGDNYVPAIFEGGQYTNVKTANLYSSTNWAQLPVALKAIALGECGGTLTLQTRLNGSPANDPFTYQNSRQVSAAGDVLTITPQVVRTNRQFTTGTFDFDITDGLYRDVDVLPENLSDLVVYAPGGWSCRAGNQERAFTLIDIPGAESSPWKGIRVRVGANEAVSCTQAVVR